MKLLVDDARIEEIKKIYEFFAVDGVTTNPTIISRSGKSPYEALSEIRAFIGDEAELHVQVISKDAENIVKEGKKIVSELGAKTYIKIPTVPEGLKAMRILSSEGYLVTATTIYTPMQAYLAAKAGADYAAPYVNRIDDLGSNGIRATRKMHDIFKNNGLKTEILAASFKTAKEVLDVAVVGSHAATIGSTIMRMLMSHTTTDTSIAGFVSDWQGAFGDVTLLGLIKATER